MTLKLSFLTIEYLLNFCPENLGNEGFGRDHRTVTTEGKNDYYYGGSTHYVKWCTERALFCFPEKNPTEESNVRWQSSLGWGNQQQRQPCPGAQKSPSSALTPSNVRDNCLRLLQASAAFCLSLSRCPPPRAPWAIMQDARSSVVRP